MGTKNRTQARWARYSIATALVLFHQLLATVGVFLTSLALISARSSAPLGDRYSLVICPLVSMIYGFLITMLVPTWAIYGKWTWILCSIWLVGHILTHDSNRLLALFSEGSSHPPDFDLIVLGAAFLQSLGYTIGVWGGMRNGSKSIADLNTFDKIMKRRGGEPPRAGDEI